MTHLTQRTLLIDRLPALGEPRRRRNGGRSIKVTPGERSSPPLPSSALPLPQMKYLRWTWVLMKMLLPTLGNQSNRWMHVTHSEGVDYVFSDLRKICLSDHLQSVQLKKVNPNYQQFDILWTATLTLTETGLHQIGLFILVISYTLFKICFWSLSKGLKAL